MNEFRKQQMDERNLKGQKIIIVTKKKQQHVPTIQEYRKYSKFILNK